MKRFKHLSFWKKAKQLWNEDFEPKSKELAESAYKEHGQHPEPVSLGFLLLAVTIETQKERIDDLEVKVHQLEDLLTKVEVT